MNEKIKTILGTGKMKVAAIATCSALVLSLGTAAAYAASSAGEKSMVRNDNGVITHSTDDGATWNEGYPDEAVVTTDENGITTVTVGEIPAEGVQGSMAIKVEDGVTYYSTDGGETWSAEIPGGVTVNEDGSVGHSFTNPNGTGGNGEKSMVRNDNGVVTHSTDGGATWNEGYPDNAVVTTDENGGTTVTVGDAPTDGSQGSMAIKVENGVTYYSTDGGATWSAEAPGGVTVNEDGSVSTSF